MSPSALVCIVLYVCIQSLVGARVVRVLVCIFMGTCMGTGTCTCTCRGIWGLFVAEDYGTVIRGDVSASRFVVVRCNRYSCCAMGVCEVIIWEYSEDGIFVFSVFCACVCACEFLIVYCSVAIRMCVRLLCVGAGNMEESSKCVCRFISCAYSFV